MLGIVLGGMFEQNLVNSMIKARGNPAAFFERPVAAVLGLLTVLVWLSPLFFAWARGRVVSPRLA